MAADGGALPPFEAGSHVDVEVAPGLVRQYSLCNPPAEALRRYRIAVLRDANSRGGSQALHDSWSAGRIVRVSVPRNAFPLDEDSRRTVLLAGGIGVTPLLSMAYRLQGLGRDSLLHYCVRSASKAAFLHEIRQSTLAPNVRFRFSDERRFSAQADLGTPDPETQLYCCGPRGFMDMVVREAASLGWPAERLHLERFGAALDGTETAFTLEARRSGLTLEVPGGKTILDVLTAAGVDVPSSCRAGVCATCLTDVIAGVPDHRDMVLTEDEKASNERIAVCCSRTLSRTLVLDI